MGLTTGLTDWVAGIMDDGWSGVLRVRPKRDIVPLRGLPGRHTGAVTFVEEPPEIEGTSVQICGLYPFHIATASPLIGAPLGNNIHTGAPVCGDPMTHFVRRVTSSPSAFVLGLNGRGKSSLVVRMLLYLIDMGYLALVLGDFKPDYVGLQEVGAEVVEMGPGGAAFNPLDAGPWAQHLDRLPPKRRTGIAESIHVRRLNVLRGLVELVLGQQLSETRSEVTVLSLALRRATERAEAAGRQPTPADVRDVVKARTGVREAIDAAGDDEYDERVAFLLRGLTGLGRDGEFGDLFTGDELQVPLDRSLVFDVSRVPVGASSMRAAVQLVCWSYGQGIAECAKILAEEGLEPQRQHMLVMDELWQILEAWDGSVYRINQIVRTNRTLGLGQIMITHSMSDLVLNTETQSKIARKFVERSAMVYIGGVAEEEIDDLRRVRRFSQKEADLLVSWSEEGSVDPATGKELPPPGRGRFLLKTGNGPGTAFHTGANLTPMEKRIHNTNEAWSERMVS